MGEKIVPNTSVGILNDVQLKHILEFNKSFVVSSFDVSMLEQWVEKIKSLGIKQVDIITTHHVLNEAGSIIAKVPDDPEGRSVAVVGRGVSEFCR
jgi:hypothetical protein